ncbi:MAG: 2-oxoacid:acceptor oxidoreductase family protein, partial [Candidatus Thermoplasmatota archaeon]
IRVVDVAKGLRSNGKVVINTTKNPEDFKFENATIYVVDATEIAVKNRLGTKTNPIVNTAMLGAYAKAVGNIKLESITQAIDESMHTKKSENIEAAKEAFEKVRSLSFFLEKERNPSGKERKRKGGEKIKERSLFFLLRKERKPFREKKEKGKRVEGETVDFASWGTVRCPTLS